MKFELIYRGDGRVEIGCEHGCGHVSKLLTCVGTEWKDWMGVHGCDGCCGSEEWRNAEAQFLSRRLPPLVVSGLGVDDDDDYQ